MGWLELLRLGLRQRQDLELARDGLGNEGLAVLARAVDGRALVRDEEHLFHKVDYPGARPRRREDLGLALGTPCLPVDAPHDTPSAQTHKIPANAYHSAASGHEGAPTMHANDALRQATAAGVPIPHIGPVLDKVPIYANNSSSWGSTPRCDTMAAMSSACGYAHCDVPRVDAPKTAIEIGGNGL